MLPMLHSGMSFTGCTGKLVSLEAQPKHRRCTADSFGKVVGDGEVILDESFLNVRLAKTGWLITGAVSDWATPAAEPSPHGRWLGAED
jgi:hypothetical protein